MQIRVCSVQLNKANTNKPFSLDKVVSSYNITYNKDNSEYNQMIFKRNRVFIHIYAYVLLI